MNEEIKAGPIVFQAYGPGEGALADDSQVGTLHADQFGGGSYRRAMAASLTGWKIGPSGCSI